MCSFEFALRARADNPRSETASVGAYFRFDDEGGGGGCEDRNPNYVEEDERARFFKLSLEVLKLVRCELGDCVATGWSFAPSLEAPDGGVEVVDCDGHPDMGGDTSSYPEPEHLDAGSAGGSDASDGGSDADADAGG